MEKNNTLTVAEVADYLKLDKLTVRLMLREGLVSWGQAVKLPNSTHWTYLIYRQRFEDETGIQTSGGGDAV